MGIIEKQKTLANEISLSSAGLHTGKEITLTIKPAPVNHGFKFKRIDIEGQPIIDAIIDNVIDTSRGTVIEEKGVRISTIEHLLAALTGMDIDNALLELDNSEVPILDGSAKYFVEAIKKTGIVEQDANREYFEIDEILSFSDPDNKVELLVIPNDTYKVSVMIDYETKVLGTQNATMSSLSYFETEISKSRTFVFLHELEFLINNNLIKGGDLSNAIVFVNKLISKEELDRLAVFFNKEQIDILEDGILNNLELYYDNEPARHKLLDVIGDLSLIGVRIKGHVIANRPGHASNTKLAQTIKDYITKIRSKDKAPTYNPNMPPVFDINEIKKMLPHRPPFLLVDKIIHIDKEKVVGIKNVTMNEAFFVGHFPEEPVMPGVLIIEAMAQAGGIFVLSQVETPEEYTTYFIKIDNVRFRSKVVPGDTLIFKLELISPFRRGISHMQGTAYVGDKIVTEAELMAQIVKKK